MDDMRIEINPGHDVMEKISRRYPCNPFYTENYVLAHQESRADTILFTVQDGNATAEHCLAFLFHGRFSNSLVVYSLTRISLSKAFWNGIRRFIKKQRIYHVYFGSYASPDGIRIEEFDKKLEKNIRTEYIADLREDDLWKQVSKHHKRQIKKARRAGVVIENSAGNESIDNKGTHDCTLNAELCKMHKMLIDCSMARRKLSNKSYVSEVDNALCIPFLENRAGTIYRAILDGEVIASSMILISNEAGYYHSSGNSAAATKTGASHLLIYTVMEDLKRHGRKLFNLGGGNNELEGLDRFKNGFGARPLSLESGEISKMPVAVRLISKLAATLKK